MRRLTLAAAAAAASFVAGAAAAHPGHGLGGGSDALLHYMTDPLHVAPLALVAWTLVLARKRLRAARARSR
jgi:hypothetical protein